jgi:hypothetical protein
MVRSGSVGHNRKPRGSSSGRTAGAKSPKSRKEAAAMKPVTKFKKMDMADSYVSFSMGDSSPISTPKMSDSLLSTTPKNSSIDFQSSSTSGGEDDPELHLSRSMPAFFLDPIFSSSSDVALSAMALSQLRPANSRSQGAMSQKTDDMQTTMLLGIKRDGKLTSAHNPAVDMFGRSLKVSKKAARKQGSRGSGNGNSRSKKFRQRSEQVVHSTSVLGHSVRVKVKQPIYDL